MSVTSSAPASAESPFGDFRGIRETARAVGVSPTTLRRAIRAGELPATRWRGRRLLIRPDDAAAWVAGDLERVSVGSEVIRD